MASLKSSLAYFPHRVRQIHSLSADKVHFLFNIFITSYHKRFYLSQFEKHLKEFLKNNK